uniref:Uncharacterized protein n=1 Tax=Physcomitrium patens TaxID=3218 RepID=A0A2K1KMB1_PHYPA|nr:hypothetical protein PHYPA_005799 [Physcomitrium patens]
MYHINGGCKLANPILPTLIFLPYPPQKILHPWFSNKITNPRQKGNEVCETDSAAVVDQNRELQIGHGCCQFGNIMGL